MQGGLHVPHAGIRHSCTWFIATQLHIVTNDRLRFVLGAASKAYRCLMDVLHSDQLNAMMHQLGRVLLKQHIFYHCGQGQKEWPWGQSSHQELTTLGHGRNWGLRSQASQDTVIPPLQQLTRGQRAPAAAKAPLLVTLVPSVTRIRSRGCLFQSLFRLVCLAMR